MRSRQLRKRIGRSMASQEIYSCLDWKTITEYQLLSKKFYQSTAFGLIKSVTLFEIDQNALGFYSEVFEEEDSVKNFVTTLRKSEQILEKVVVTEANARLRRRVLDEKVMFTEY